VKIFAQPSAALGFLDYVSNRLNPTIDRSSSDKTLLKVCPIAANKAARRVLMEYGAMFAASDRVTVPPVCIFQDQVAVQAFHQRLETTELNVDGAAIRLQTPAAKSMATLLESAGALNLHIRPLDGAVAGGRDFADTSRIWNSRVEPALEYWTRRGKISVEDGSTFRSLPLKDQIEKIIQWEESGLLFGTGRGICIFSSTAPPGTSQHLSLIAFDVAPPVTSIVRTLFNANGWYQTVRGDVSHFTYLGLVESELPKRGLVAVRYNGVVYWIPNFGVAPPATSPSN